MFELPKLYFHDLQWRGKTDFRVLNDTYPSQKMQETQVLNFWNPLLIGINSRFIVYNSSLDFKLGRGVSKVVEEECDKSAKLTSDVGLQKSMNHLHSPFSLSPKTISFISFVFIIFFIIINSWVSLKFESCW